MTRTTMIGGTAGLTRPVFLDIAGRDRVKRVALACDSVVSREAADLADRQQRPALAAALRDSAHIAHTFPLR